MVLPWGKNTQIPWYIGSLPVDKYVATYVWKVLTQFISSNICACNPLKSIIQKFIKHRYNQQLGAMRKRKNPTNHLQKVKTFLLDLRNSVSTFSALPFKRFETKFNFSSLSHEIIKEENLILCKNNLNLVARLTQLIVEIHELLADGRVSTKRELYYKYLNLYKERYQTVSSDINILCYSLGGRRADLNIVGSSKCILHGNIAFIDSQDHTLQISKKTNFYLPNISDIRIQQLKSKIVVVVEKQSAFQNLVSRSRNPNHFIITSKGYPDFTTQEFLLQLSSFTSSFFYIGDLDPFGFDIMMTYALGNYTQGFGLMEMEWINLESLLSILDFDISDIEKQYMDLSSRDISKLGQLLSQDSLGSSDLLNLNAHSNPILLKFKRWKEKMITYLQLGKKVEIEGFLKFIPSDIDVVELVLAHEMIV